jgi:hypothetical protein
VELKTHFNSRALNMGTNILPDDIDYSQTGFHFQSAAHLNTAKQGANVEFVERFCKWSKTMIMLMFISPVALFT